MGVDIASLRNGFTSVGKEQLDALALSFDYIRSQLTDDERDDFGLELLDAARSNAAEFQSVLGTWYMTAHLRTHPDYDVQKKEYENLVMSGELTLGLQLGSAPPSVVEPLT